MTIVGVDGCKKGWIAVFESNGEHTAAVFNAFEEIVIRFPLATIAVDMPIGLYDTVGHGGRGPETIIRPLLKMRQSSVFSIPSRGAVYAETDPLVGVEAIYAAHKRASAIARESSNPSRAISIQAFGIFSKIREIDALLRNNPKLRMHVFESHPELAFWMLNGKVPMSQPKKVKSRINPSGIEERKALLGRSGYERSFLDQMPPRGASYDDFLDAAAMMLVARRCLNGEAISFPDPPGLDSEGIPVAIWA